MPKHYSDKYKKLQHNQIDYQELVDRRRNEVEEIVVDKSRDFRRYNTIAKAKDLDQEKISIGNKTFNSIYAGWVNSKNKDSYIKRNRDHILKLPIGQQKKFVQLILPYL